MRDAIERMLRAAALHGLRLRSDEARLDESGMDFIALHAVDDAGVEWIARVPRREDVIEAAVVEGWALTLVRSRLPVAVPHWQVHTRELIAYPRLPGLPAATYDPEAAGGYAWCVDPEDPGDVFLGSLAGALAALHTIDPHAALASGLPGLEPDDVRSTLEARIRRTRNLLQLPEPLRRRWEAWLADDTYWPGFSTLIHGDLHPGHILVNRDYRVTGLLDWTEARVDDPASDLAILSATFSPPVLDELLRRYERAGGRTWPRMREHIGMWWSVFPVAIAMIALKSGSDEPLALARALVAAQADAV